MSKNIFNLAERATGYIKENIKSDINEDEVTGELYQEFSESTKAKVEILDRLQTGQGVVVQGMRDKRLNGRKGYIVAIDRNVECPIVVDLHIEDDIFAKYCFKRENLRSV